ncbi:MAG: metallothionein [Thiovulaceae bacterium]|nr:metallothionein [Sulfurimonadaceae bacterium]
MFKLLLLGVAFYLVYVIFFKKSPLSYAKKSDPKNNKPTADEMVACEKCQTYTAVDETIIKDGHYYCSSECAKES